ncbi:MAG: HAD-IA family hydrolase [Actinomycetota bacterium]|nr:HAD-IA family hydrolase [Actinomycetota bacterium]
MTIEVVFFDAGETILHPHPSFAELFAEVCARRGEEVDPADVLRVQERLAPHLVDLAEDTGVERGPTLSEVDSRTFWMFLYRRFLGELGIERTGLAEDLYGVFSTVSTYRLFGDALPAIGELRRAGLRTGLISNFEAWLEKILVELEVGHLFDVVVISGVDGVEKPDPAIYELALERAAVAPGAAAHVGDSLSLDVRPAREAGMHAILLDRPGRYPEEPGPKIASLEELPHLIPNL